ncbi:MAG: tetratricopeptide repeat protein [Pirellulales bacterium]
MASHQRIRRQKIVTQAEGYLELGMPQRALEVLSEWGEHQTLHGRALYLRGEALRSLHRHADALDCFHQATVAFPDDIHILLAMGWCYKRLGQLDQAVEMLETALTIAPEEAILHYNLACYFSLAGNKRLSLECLARALDIDSNFRDLIPDERDFDPVRNDPAFQQLTSVIV